MRKVSVQYNHSKWYTLIENTSFRKKDFDGLDRFNRFDKNKISINVEGFNLQNFISINEDSPGCFSLRFNCEKFQLTSAKHSLIVHLLYNNKPTDVNFNIIVQYPLLKPSFRVKFEDIKTKWDRFVKIGKLYVIADTGNTSPEWWQYTEKQYLFVKTTSRNIVYMQNDKYCIEEKFGYKVSLLPNKLNAIDIAYNGDDRCNSNSEVYKVQYYIGSTPPISWENIDCQTIIIEPLIQSLQIRKSSLPSSLILDDKNKSIFKFDVLEGDNSAPHIGEVFCNKSSNLLIISSDKKQANANYCVSLDLTRIKEYPIATQDLKIGIRASNVHKEESIDFKFGSTVKQFHDYIRLDLPKDIFEVNDMSNQDIYAEELNSLGKIIKIKNQSHLKIRNIDISLTNAHGLVFESGLTTTIKEILPGQTIDIVVKSKGICGVHGKSIYSELNILVRDSNYSQKNSIQIPIKKKVRNPLTFTIKPILQNSHQLGPNDKLFSIVITNPAPNGCRHQYEDYDVASFSTLQDYRLIPIQGSNTLKPGQSIEFNVTCNVIKSNCNDTQSLPEFKLFYNLVCQIERQIKFVHNKYAMEVYNLDGTYLSNDGVKTSFPVDITAKKPVAKLHFESKPFVANPDDSTIYIQLPDEVRVATILSSGFSFDGSMSISSDSSETIIYIEPNYFKTDNIPVSEQLNCVIGSQSQYRSRQHELNIIIEPLDSNPIIEVECENQSLFPFPGDSLDPISCGEIEFYEEELKLNKLKKVHSFLVFNRQVKRYSNKKGLINFLLHNTIYIDGRPIQVGPNNPFEVSTTLLELESKSNQSVYLNLSMFKLGQLLSRFQLENKIHDFVISLQISSENNKSYIQLSGTLKSRRNDQVGWYALDLGTTGIVVAKKDGPQVAEIEINTSANYASLENDSKILSSIVGINVEGTPSPNDGIAKISLIESLQHAENREEVLPATKFIIDQKEIPFYSTYKERYSGYNLFENDNKLQELTSDILIQSLYRHILSKIGTFGINRLTLTYPNTYTNNQIQKIKELIQYEYPQLDGYINAVPESDAVLAHYLSLRSMPGSEKPLPEGSENIVIFDMGAGTLDICYVKFNYDQSSYTGTAKIERKIGIPVAGDYLNFAFYLALKDSVGSAVFANPKMRRRVLENQKTLPYNNFTETIELQDAKITVQELLAAKPIMNYLEYCGNRVFQVLFATDKWQEEIDTIVFTGRASRFKPLREFILKRFENRSEEVADLKTISDSDLKKSVAIGAIEYTQSFSAENDANAFKIISRNQYLNLYVVYEDYGKGMNRVVKCKKIIAPDNFDWDDVEVVNGTKSQEMQSDVIISVCPSSLEIILIQSLLREEDIIKVYENKLKRHNNMELIDDECFVNEIFRMPTYCLGADLNKLNVGIRVLRNNEIIISINDDVYRGEKIRESIENNRYYNVNRTLLTCDN